MTLYELQDEYLNLLTMLEEDPDEADEQAIHDTIEMILMDIDEKAEGYGQVLKQMQADAEAIKAEKLRLARKQAGIEKNMDRLRGALLSAMLLTGKTKIKTKLFSFSTRETQKVVLDLPVNEIPPDFWKVKDPEADTKAIGEYLKAGHEVDFAHFEPAHSLTVR